MSISDPVTPDFPDTIPDLLDWRARSMPTGAWLETPAGNWTFADVLEAVDRTAVGLAARGVVHGDRVSVLLPNRAEVLFAWLGANRLGAIFASLNPQYTPFEIAGQLRLTTPRVLVVDGDELRAKVIAACDLLDASLRPLVASPSELVSDGRGAPVVRVSPDDVAVLLATSGTTGASKAVMQTHRTYTLTAESFPHWVGLSGTDRVLIALPLFHINAQAYSTMGALGAGARLAMIDRFSATRFWSDVARTGATQCNVVGAILQILLKAEPHSSERQHALRTVYAALALPEHQHAEFERRFGVQLMVGYGLSETTFGTVWPRTGKRPYGTMGVLRQHPRLGEVNRARVVRDDGSDAAGSEAGELLLSNPGIMKGYWADTAQTAAVLSDGWLRTGDLVRRDADGNFVFVARKKDVLRRRGENVAAAEIEVALAAHDDVLEAAAIGVPAELGEDDIVAFVAPRAGHTIDVDALRAWVGHRLAAHKIPSRIHVLPALPRTATERVAKYLLKEPRP